MSTIIVPIAGPDFYSKEFGIRPLFPVDGTTLIEYVLKQRPWFPGIERGDDQLVFVMRETPPHSNEMRAFITRRFPLANMAVLGRTSLGAPMSALAGLALSQRPEDSVIVDLADIAFDMPEDPREIFSASDTVDGVVPYFVSNDPKFSYLRIDGDCVLEAREKIVISSNASAGVYLFRDAATFLKAQAYCLRSPEICKVGSALFVCPSMNGLIADEREVRAVAVRNAEPIGLVFHKQKPGTI